MISSKDDMTTALELVTAGATRPAKDWSHEDPVMEGEYLIEHIDSLMLSGEDREIFFSSLWCRHC